MGKKMMNIAVRFFALSIITLSMTSQAAWRSDECEAARNKLLEPLRKAKIKECQSDPKNDAAWCERFYADYGNATSAGGGKMNRRMYDDIPECKEKK